MKVICAAYAAVKWSEDDAIAVGLLLIFAIVGGEIVKVHVKIRYFCAIVKQ